jgi:hypothetical protein
MTSDLSRIYDNAKEEHARGLQVLMDEFNYHPAFKRPGDEFFAVPFRCKDVTIAGFFSGCLN